MSFLLLSLFPLFMAFAAFSDLFTMRIANWLVLGMAAVFGPVALLAGMPVEAVGMHLLAALLVLAIGFGLFALGWIGGGDAKFAAASALWLGFGPLLGYALYAALLGGALTLVLLAIRNFALPARLVGVEWVARLHHAKTGVPYGIALAAAGVLVYPNTALYALLMG